MTTFERNHFCIWLAGLRVAACFFGCICRVAQENQQQFLSYLGKKYGVHKDVPCGSGRLTSSN